MREEGREGRRVDGGAGKEAREKEDSGGNERDENSTRKGR